MPTPLKDFDADCRCVIRSFAPVTLLLATLLASNSHAGSDGVAGDSDTNIALAAGKNDLERIEFFYLHEFTARIMDFAQHYARIGNVPADFAIAELDRYEKCHPLLPALETQAAEIAGDHC